MSVIIVSHEKQMREAFAAGQHSSLPALMRASGKKIDPKTAKWLAAIPQTYEAWIETKRDEPQIARL